MLDIYIKNFGAVETWEKILSGFPMVCPNSKWQQKTMKGPNIEILTNIDFYYFRT